MRRRPPCELWLILEIQRQYVVRLVEGLLWIGMVIFLILQGRARSTGRKTSCVYLLLTDLTESGMALCVNTDWKRSSL